MTHNRGVVDPHLVSGTGDGAAASADVVVNFTVPAGGAATFGACVLAAGPKTAPFVPHWSVQPNTNAAYDKVTPGNNKAASLLGDFPTADECWGACAALSHRYLINSRGQRGGTAAPIIVISGGR